MEENALEKALMLDPQVREEEGHGLLLVFRAREVFREAAAGETRCNLRPVARRSANDGDPGT